MNKANVFMKDGRTYLGSDMDSNGCGINDSGTAFSFWYQGSNKSLLMVVPFMDIKFVELYADEVSN